MAYLFKFYLRLFSFFTNQNNKNNRLSAIVFSKDRPMQLDALLRSLKLHSASHISLTILYALSDDIYYKAYEDVKKEYPEYKYILESNFKKDLLVILRNMTSEKIFFLVDDIIFINKFNIESINKYNANKYVPSLRLGENISYSYMKDKSLVLPNLSSINNEIIEWNWIKNNSYWSYPLSLDGHIFNRTEIIYIFSITKFWSPNSLEGNIQKFSSFFENRKGCSFEKSVIVNFPWNKVQVDNNNRSGDITSEYLLELWNKGKRIDITRYSGKVYNSAHVEEELYIY